MFDMLVHKVMLDRKALALSIFRGDGIVASESQSVFVFRSAAYGTGKTSLSANPTNPAFDSYLIFFSISSFQRVSIRCKRQFSISAA